MPSFFLNPPQKNDGYIPAGSRAAINNQDCLTADVLTWQRQAQTSVSGVQ